MFNDLNAISNRRASKPVWHHTVMTCLLMLSFLFSGSSWAVDSEQVTEMIAKADRYRLNSEQASKVVSVVHLLTMISWIKLVSTTSTRVQIVNHW